MRQPETDQFTTLDSVPPRGLEPRTNGLKVRCSTVELEGLGATNLTRLGRQARASADFPGAISMTALLRAVAVRLTVM